MYLYILSNWDSDFGSRHVSEIFTDRERALAALERCKRNSAYPMWTLYTVVMEGSPIT